MNRRGFLGMIVPATLIPTVKVKKTGEEPFKGVGILRVPSEAFHNRDVLAEARAAGENIRSGGVLVLPSTRDEHGELMWDFTIVGGDPQQVSVERSGE